MGCKNNHKTIHNHALSCKLACLIQTGNHSDKMKNQIALILAHHDFSTHTVNLEKLFELCESVNLLDAEFTHKFGQLHTVHEENKSESRFKTSENQFLNLVTTMWTLLDVSHQPIMSFFPSSPQSSNSTYPQEEQISFHFLNASHMRYEVTQGYY